MRPAKWAELAGFLVLGACGPGGNSNGTGGASNGAFLERDSAGILIAVTPGSKARAALGWEVDTVPDLVIGQAGKSARDESAQRMHALDRIGGVRQLPDGRVVVVDGGSKEVRFFDSRGHFLNRVGGRGQGLGEFGDDPILVPAFQGDSLLLFDTRSARFYFLSTEDGGYRLVRPATWKGAEPPVGFVNPNVLLEHAIADEPAATGVSELPTTYAWTNIVSGTRTLVDSFSVRRELFVQRRGGPGFTYLIPFSSTPAATVSRNGALITEGRLPEIREYDVEGRLRRIIRIAEPIRRITAADIQRYFQVTGRPVYIDMHIPEVPPTFESLLVDDEGWLWAKMYQYDPALRSAWVVFDAGGRAHGSIQTPPGLRVHQVDSDFVLGVWTDERGVEYVRRHRVKGRGGWASWMR